MTKRVLGRGLGAFFPEYQDDEPDSGRSKQTSGKGKTKSVKKTAKQDRESLDRADMVNVVLDIPVSHIRPNPHQPRKHFSDDALEELSESIKQHGLIQPITVRYLGEKRFELISGERRLRAGKLAGLDVIPAYIRDADDEQLVAFALIENIQRVDLNPLEVAMGYKRLMEEMSYTQEEVAKKVGKNRATVANMLRLLSLPDFIQAALRDELITSGHARALINLKSTGDQKKLLKQIIDQELSVRDIESSVQLMDKKNRQKDRPKKTASEDPFLKEISQRLRRTLGTRVDVKQKSKGGEIRIAYYSDDDLERILQFIDSAD